MVGVFLCSVWYNGAMHRFFLEEKFEENISIQGPKAHHILNVLRMQPDEELELVFDDGIIARMRIEEVASGYVALRSLEILEKGSEPMCQVTLAQGLAKGEKMDFVLQKVVELGAEAIIPLAMENCVVKIPPNKQLQRLERWSKIIAAAAAQSHRDRLPRLFPISTLSEALAADYDLILLAYEGERQTMLKEVLRGSNYKKILVIIGPEGGISPAELALAAKFGAKRISLGKRILRTETAGIVVLSNIFYELG